ncbi:unnamed protein product [Allacma fusca]|uniref:Uncharacterized protein n=1 Tax=Allacma fusca TaxID=39272 RepID=A0A8J2L285_9HEXA|nr:unnamed protein product [Allacma fusca]
MQKWLCSSSNKLTSSDITSKHVVCDYNSHAENAYKDFNDHMERILAVTPLLFNELKTFIEKEKKIAEVIFTELCGNFRTDLSEDEKKDIAYRLISLRTKINARADRCKIDFLFQNTVMKAVEDAKEFHTQKMTDFVQQNVPLTESQIKKYHGDCLEAVTDAFTSTFQIKITQISSRMLKTTLHKLTRSINSQLIVHLQRHEIEANKIIKEIQMCTLEAEALYDAEMDAFIQNYGTSDGLSYVDESFKVHHQKVRQKAELLWQNTIRSRKLETFLNADADLRKKLDEKYSYLVDDADKYVADDCS